MDEAKPPAVLCVDDDPRVLHGLFLTLRADFALTPLTRADQALAQLRAGFAPAVVLCDLRLPGMDGIEFLVQVRRMAPEAVRVLLVGSPELDNTIKAVNECEIFRLLAKPCPPARLIATLHHAVGRHHALVADRERLLNTLHGSVEVLTDLLAIVAPEAHARALRIKRHARAIARVLSAEDAWSIEVAAMLSQMAPLMVPPFTSEKLQQGRPLSTEDRALIERVPGLTRKILGHIPRLDTVLEILESWPRRYDGSGDGIAGAVPSVGARIVRVAADYEALDDGRADRGQLVEALRQRTGYYDPAVLTALEAVPTMVRGGPFAVALPALEPGMVLADDLRASSGVLLMARGHECTHSSLDRLRNFTESGVVAGPVLVYTPPP